MADGLDAIIRALREAFTNEQLEKMGGDLVLNFIQNALPNAWQWAKDHLSDVMDAIGDFFSG
ncbi:hypothetical protein Aple_031890 [Acrocarpospora pleiomorpha]|uniref:Uncharacterized protein n=1 Tax=Acrocarpospora pleiomorpha TaxID=90975 RepID=A0A5M3XMA6_9ACTN|nr:hypothetical protein [Acrocarpospora pleiomorpha]GES20293.1 hypothetical protein Aple_031890 [Acrocarpospora pleiomorpha]